MRLVLKSATGVGCVVYVWTRSRTLARTGMHSANDERLIIGYPEEAHPE